MTDTLSPERRSWNMSRIRGKDTKPEKMVRSLLHRRGWRFTVNGPKNRELPGKPDIVLPKHRAVVFVHGCFWHHHRGCGHAYTPKTRVEFWTGKFRENAARDRRVRRELRKLGWSVLTVWECETRKDLTPLAEKIDRFMAPPTNSG